MIRFILLSSLLFALLCACTSYVRLMDSWVGASEEELVAKWGEPDSVAKYEDAKVYTYEKYWIDTDDVYNRGRFKFVIDQEGTVVNWQKVNFPDYLFGEQKEDLSRD